MPLGGRGPCPRVDRAQAPSWTGPGPPNVRGPGLPVDGGPDFLVNGTRAPVERARALGWRGPDSGPLVGRGPGLLVDDVHAPVTRVDGGPDPRVDGARAPGPGWMWVRAPGWMGPGRPDGCPEPGTRF